MPPEGAKANDKRLTCPLKQSPSRAALCYCAQDKCAWWDENSQRCAVLLLAQRFDAVTTTDDTLGVTIQNATDGAWAYYTAPFGEEAS